MGDLELHVAHIPLRSGWRPKDVRALLSKIVRERPDYAVPAAVHFAVKEQVLGTSNSQHEVRSCQPALTCGDKSRDCGANAAQSAPKRRSRPYEPAIFGIADLEPANPLVLTHLWS